MQLSGGNFPWGECPGAIVLGGNCPRGATVLGGNCLGGMGGGGNCPGGNCPVPVGNSYLSEFLNCR